MPDSGSPNHTDLSFRRLMAVSISARLLVDTGVQIFSPYLPVIASGLGITVVTLGRLVSLRSAMGLFAPFFGAQADKHGYRLILRIGLVLNAIGLIIFASSTTPIMALAGMIFAGLGMASFVPTLQAYLSARLPYAQRARGIGILEYSWAFTGIVGLFLVGQLMAIIGWRAPFYLLGAGMLAMAMVFGVLPTARASTSERHLPPVSSLTPAQRIRVFFHFGLNARSTYGTIFVAALNMYAGMQLMITYGLWLGHQYGLGPSQLGIVALILGFFDLCASVSVSLFTDSFGKRRSVLLGTGGSFVGYLLLPFLNVGLVPAILGIGLARGFFEFAIVSNFPLLSEQAPEQRGKLMTLSAAVSLTAVTVASFIAPAVYTQYDVYGVAFLSALAAGLALYILLTHVREIPST